MRVIHKYPLSVGFNRLAVAGGNFKPLCVQLQNGTITAWGELDSGLHPKDVAIHVFGTGWEIPSHLNYIGTVQIPDGTVWHAYW